MNIKNKITEITLGEKTYKMKFDFETIARIQAELRKNGLPYKFFEIFESLESQDFSVILPLIVHSIQRMHPQVKKEIIIDALGFDNLETVIQALLELIENSMPKNDDVKKK